MSENERLIRHAMKLAETYPHALAGCEFDNSEIGAAMWIALRQPRSIIEAACREAKARLEAQA